MGTTYTVPTSVTDFSGTEYILPGHANWRPSAHIFGRITNDSNVIENISIMNEFGVLVPLEPDPLWEGRKVQAETYSLKTYFTADIEIGSSFLTNINPIVDPNGDLVNLDSGVIGSQLYYPAGTFPARPDIDQKYPLIGPNGIDYPATIFSLSEEASKTVIGGEFSILVGKPFSYGTQVESVDVANRTMTVKSSYGVGGVAQYGGFVRLLLPAPDVSDILRFWFTNYIGDVAQPHADGDAGKSAANAQSNSFSFTPIWAPMSGVSSSNPNTIRFRAGETYPIQYGLNLGEKNNDTDMPDTTIVKVVPRTGVTLSSVTRPAVGNLVTVTCSAAHGFSAGDLITVSGASPTALNGFYKINSVTTNAFTYILAGTTLLTASAISLPKIFVASYKGGLPTVVPHAWRNMVFDFTDVILEHDDRDDYAAVQVKYNGNIEADVFSGLASTPPTNPPIASVTNVDLLPSKWSALGSTVTGDGASVQGTIKGITQGFNSTGAASCYAHWSKIGEEGPLDGFFLDYGYQGINSATYTVSANQPIGSTVQFIVSSIGGLATGFWVKFVSHLDSNIFISGAITAIDNKTRAVSVLVDGASGTTTPDNSVAITSLVRVANTYSASGMTATDIGLQVGDPITISGTSSVLFDGTFKVASVDSDNPRIITFGDSRQIAAGPVSATLHGPSWDLDIKTKELVGALPLYKVSCVQYPPNPNWRGLPIQARQRLGSDGADQVFGSVSYGNNTHIARNYVKEFDVTSFTRSVATYDPLKSGQSTVVGVLTIAPSADPRGYLSANTGITVKSSTNSQLNGDYVITSRSGISASGQNLMQVTWSQGLSTRTYSGIGMVRDNGIVQADFSPNPDQFPDGHYITVGDTVEVVLPKNPSFTGKFEITEVPNERSVRWVQAGANEGTQGDLINYVGAINLQTFLPASGSGGIVLTRSSLGKVSATLPGHQLALNNKIEVTAADSSYSGIFVVTAIAGNLISWSNAGTAGTSTASQILHRTGSVTSVGAGTLEVFLPIMGLFAGAGTMTNDPNKLTTLAYTSEQLKWWNLPHVNNATIVRVANVVTATMSASAVTAAGGINFDPAHPLVKAGALSLANGGLRIQASKTVSAGNFPDPTFDGTVGIQSIAVSGDSVVVRWNQTGADGSAIADLRGLNYIYIPDKDGIYTLMTGGSKVDQVIADINNPGKAAIVIAGSGHPNLTRENYPLYSSLPVWEQRRQYGTAIVKINAPGSINLGGSIKTTTTLGSALISATSFDYRWLPHTVSGDSILGQLVDGTMEEFTVKGTWAVPVSGSTTTVITCTTTPASSWVGWTADNVSASKIYFAKSTITAVDIPNKRITINTPAVSGSAAAGTNFTIIPLPGIRLFPYGTRIASAVASGTLTNVTLTNPALITGINQTLTLVPEHKSLINKDILIKGGTWLGPNIDNMDSVNAGKEAWYGIQILSGDNITIQDFSLSNVWSDFLNFYGAIDWTNGQNIFPQNILIDNGTFVTSGRHGIVAHGLSGVKIQNCSFRSMDHWFIDCESFSNAKIIDFSIEDSTVSDAALGFMSMHPNLEVFGPPRKLTNATISNMFDATGTLRAQLKVINPTSRPFTSDDTGALIINNANLPAYCYIRSVLAYDTVELSVSTIGAAASGTVATGQTAVLKDPALFRDFALTRVDRFDGTLNVLGNIGSATLLQNFGQVQFYGDYTAGSNVIKNVRMLQRADEADGTPFTYDTTYPTWSTDGSIKSVSVYSPPGTGFKSWIGQNAISIPNSYTAAYTSDRKVVSIKSVNATGGDQAGTGIYEVTVGSAARLNGKNILSYLGIHRINWTGFTMEDCRTSGNTEWRGGHSGLATTASMILLPICWDRVSITNNVAAAGVNSVGGSIYYAVGFCDRSANSTRPRTSVYNTGIPTTDALGNASGLTWTVSHNYWPRALDNQFTPSATITPFSLTSSENPGYPYPAPTFTVNATSSISASLLNEPFVVRYSDITNDQTPTSYQRITLGAGGTGATTKLTIPAGANYFMSAKFPGSQTHQYKVVELGQTILENPNSIPTSVTVTTSPVSGITPTDPVTISVTVTPASGVTVPSGTVRLRRSFNNGTVEEIGSSALVGGSASFSLGTLAIGNYLMIAVYDPTDLFAFDSSTGTKSFNVNTTPPPELTPTTITLSHTPTNPLLFEQIEIVATVTPDIAGYVIFKDAFNGVTTQLGDTWTVTGGVTSVTIPRILYADVPVGLHTISGIFYPTSALYSTSFGTDEILITAPPEPTATTLSLSSIPTPAEGMFNSDTLEIIIMVDQAIDGICTVTDLSGGVLRDLGTVEILDGLGVATLSSFVVGSHYIETIFTPTDELYIGSRADLTIETYPIVPTKGWSVGPLNS
jgi:hypothetical protein